MEKGLKLMNKKRVKEVRGKSLKKRLVGSFMIVIFISVAAFEGLLIYFTRYYFYNNMESILTNQIKISSDFYSRYFSNVPLQDNILDNVDIFWKQTSAEVQIVNTNGEILMDSIGADITNKAEGNDFQDALKGGRGTRVGTIEGRKSRVMIISYPLKSGDKVIGVLRFISSLEGVDKIVNRISSIFIIIGAIAVLGATIVSVFLAQSIVSPIRKITSAAEEMAGGNLKVRVRENSDDEIGKLGRTLNFMAGEIQNRDQIKNEFISSVSHELRTPLTAIKGWAITLNDGELQDKEILSDGLRIIEKESERLSLMVEELLDFSKFVSGKVTLNKEKIQMNSIVEYIGKYLSPRAEREGIEFEVICEEAMPIIEVDPSRIKQLLINVIDNAFKFTGAGGKVTVNAFIEEDSVVITIKDTGCGISEEELPRVKEKFYKGKNSKSQNGIGLSICDEIANLHGGSLVITSAVNIGTTVRITLPLK